MGRVLGVNPVDLRCLDWLTEGPRNMMKAQRKAMKEMQHAAPFKVERNREYDEEE